MNPNINRINSNSFQSRASFNANTSNDEDVSYNNSDDYNGVSNRDDFVNDVNANNNDANIVNNHDFQIHNESLPENLIS